MVRKIRWAITILVVGAVIFFIFVAPRFDSPENNNNPASQSKKTDNSDKLIIGNPSAPKTLIEYGDYKCPNCAKFHNGAYVELKRDYIDTGKIKLEFRNLPYINSPGDSRLSAEGSYCANEQGLFEQYHSEIYSYTDQLYAREGSGKEYENVLNVDLLGRFVSKNGGNEGKFKKCLLETKYKSLVDRDLKLSGLDEVSGTPTFIIDERKIVGAQPIAIFRTLLEAY